MPGSAGNTPGAAPSERTTEMQDNSILVPLTQGKFAIIDAEDAERIRAHKWCHLQGGYAVRARPRSCGSREWFTCIEKYWVSLTPRCTSITLTGTG